MTTTAIAPHTAWMMANSMVEKGKGQEFLRFQKKSPVTLAAIWCGDRYITAQDRHSNLDLIQILIPNLTKSQGRRSGPETTYPQDIAYRTLPLFLVAK